MPYTVKTKDGIILQNIPDELAPDSPEVRARVDQARASRPIQMVPSHVVTQPLPEAPPAPEPKTTVGGVVSAVNRALLPVAAGAGAGAVGGAFFGGVGAVPGAVAGAASVVGAKALGDPLISGINSLFGTNYTQPSEALQHLMTRLGMPEPRTEAERIVQAASETAAGAIGGIGLGTTLARTGFSPAAQAVGRALASQPASQLAGAVGGGAASQATAEAGGGPVAQLGAGLAGAVLAGAPFAKPIPRTSSLKPNPATMAEVAAPEAVAVEGSMARAAIPEPAPVVPREIPQADLGTLVKKASEKGLGAAASKAQLADMAAVNPEAMDAAKRLGLDLPMDVFSDNPQIRSAVGLTRSAAGSPAEAAWRTTVINAVDQADTVIRDMGATYHEGAVSPGVVSEKVLGTLKATKEALNADAVKIYGEVDQAVPKSTPVRLPKVEETLVQLLDEVGEAGLSTPERKLLKLVDSPDGIPYGRLLREKSLMGAALARKESPYGNMEAGALKRLYGALAEDQLTAVSNVAPGLGDKLKGANLIYAQERKLGDLIVGAFGDDARGSIANKMRAAITDSAKGGSGEFARLMEVVPKEHQKEVVATALASATRSARGAERGGAGFSEYAKLYPALRANAPVYKQVVEALGPESHQVMRDLFEVSRRITDARAQVLTTGKANQAVLNAMKAENLVSKVMNSTVAKSATVGASALGGGPIGAGMASAITNALSNGKKDVLVAAGEMFASDEFKRLALEAATRANPSGSTVKALSTSARFQRFARLANLPGDRQNWILNAMRAETSTKEKP